MSKNDSRPAKLAKGAAANDAASTPSGNFIRSTIEGDLAHQRYGARTWAGKPGDATIHAGQPADPAKIRTRFPPEPNGYLHFGHSKSICLNFGLARDFGGVCHMRFDDTNPEKEEQEYVDSIIEAVKWLGFDWQADFGRGIQSHLYYASDYFDFMYEAAEYLISTGNAYVESLTAEQMRALRGTLTEPGRNSPYRDRGIEENLALFRGMREGRYKDGEHVLRARIDMAAPNINLRDPAIYRIKHAEHHRTGEKWCIYPMYTFAHPIEDALENITHSICTLEFEDQRPFYDWLLRTLIPLLHPAGFDKYLGELARWLMHDFDERLPVFRREADKLGLEGINAPLNEAGGGNHDEAMGAVAEAMSRLRRLPEQAYRLGLDLLRAPDSGYRYTPDYIGLPRQIEFARLNLTYVVLSKRKLIELVEDRHVEGWDDPRMPTLVGARRRGYTPEGFRLFAERVGVSKSNSWIDYSILEDCMREDLNERAPRRIAVLDPLKLIIDNYPADQEEECHPPNHPQKPDWGKRDVPFSKELWIEREDFAEVPPPKYFRLYPPGVNSAGQPQAGNKVRLKYGFVVECTGCDKDAEGNITAVHCNYFADSKSGTPGSDTYKVKGNIHWVSARHAYSAEVRLYDRLFKDPHPGAGDRNFIDDLNPDSVKTVHAQMEPALREAKVGEHYQFERHGYFVPDRIDPISGAPEFNRAVTLRDAWQK